MKSTELILADSPTSLAIDTSSTGLLYWLVEYANAEIAGSPADTVRAKTGDLKKFYEWFSVTLRSDDVDDWTKRLSKDYRTWLGSEANNGKQYAATTINRHLATLRHAAKWIQQRREFMAGYPLEGVADIGTPPPEALGLTPVQKARVRAAADKLVRLQTQPNQRPLRNYAIQSCLFKTGMRVTELCRLNFDQYQGKHFINVQRKGDNATPRLYLPEEARDDLDTYLKKERGTDPGPLFMTTTGGRIVRQQIDRYLRQLMALANANVPENEQINLHAHLLRHTRLKEMAKKDRAYALRASGNKGPQHIDRYLNPLDEDFEAVAEQV